MDTPSTGKHISEHIFDNRFNTPYFRGNRSGALIIGHIKVIDDTPGF